MMARHVFDKSIADTLVKFVEQGNYVSVGCRAAGISKSTYFHWLELGAAYCEAEAAGKTPNPDHKVFVEFRRRIEAARAKWECQAVETIRSSGEKDWRSLAWLLERKSAKRWGSKDKIDTSAASPESGVKEAQQRVNADKALSQDVARLADSLSGKLGK